jgi:hypothetical protein
MPIYSILHLFKKSFFFLDILKKEKAFGNIFKDFNKTYKT